MTNINCTENCVYQKEGKCTFEKVVNKTVISNSSCVYYTFLNDKCKPNVH